MELHTAEEMGKSRVDIVIVKDFKTVKWCLSSQESRGAGPMLS